MYSLCVRHPSGKHDGSVSGRYGNSMVSSFCPYVADIFLMNIRFSTVLVRTEVPPVLSFDSLLCTVCCQASVNAYTKPPPFFFSNLAFWLPLCKTFALSISSQCQHFLSHPQMKCGFCCPQRPRLELLFLSLSVIVDRRASYPRPTAPLQSA